jgi:hypothetical protein
MATLRAAYQAIESLLSRPNRPRSDAPGPDELGTADECLDCVLGGLIEGGDFLGDRLSSSEITKTVLQPIFKDAGNRGFHVWRAHRTGTMRMAMAADAGRSTGRR